MINDVRERGRFPGGPLGLAQEERGTTRPPETKLRRHMANRNYDKQRHIEWLRDAFQSHQKALVAYACRMLNGDLDRAEEAVQETFLRLCREQREEVDGHLRAWLFTVCRSRVIDMQRRENMRLATTASASEFEGFQMGRSGSTRASSSDLPETIVERGEAHALLARLIQGLPFQQRELLHLKVQGELTYREIAEATGLTVSNVGYHLHQAMLTLRAELQRVERSS